MVDKSHPKLSVSRQCDLLELHRSGLYYKPCDEDPENLEIMRLMDEQYFKTPFYGSRRLCEWLQSLGYKICRKRVRRLLDIMGWKTLYPRPNTSKPGKGHPVYPYLLRGLQINKANQVWAMDITYIPMKRGFMYLTAIIDLHTRYVLNWSLSNTMTAEWCADVAAQAICKYGPPEIFNTDQGSQFTSEIFTSALHNKQIKISMDGKGRAVDNIIIERLWRSVKYEHVYLYNHEDGISLYEGLKDYFEFYNFVRKHQSLNYQSPASQYLKAA